MLVKNVLIACLYESTERAFAFTSVDLMFKVSHELGWIALKILALKILVNHPNPSV